MHILALKRVAVSNTVEPSKFGISIIASVSYPYFCPASTSLKNLSSITGARACLDCRSSIHSINASCCSFVFFLKSDWPLSWAYSLAACLIWIAGSKHCLKIFPPSRPIMLKSIRSSIGVSSNISALVQYCYQGCTKQLLLKYIVRLVGGSLTVNSYVAVR